ncbi:MAG: acyl-CoA thioesterase [Alphaproteobacteria bacterium]|nr:acyl-CoA thioesterase [Alphaproteobacteria bacterium]MCB9929914.1 acyl-CoA thioesterase [Alphaproteobacteria bacterium]
MRRPEAAATIDLSRRETFRDWAPAILRYRDLDPNGHVNHGVINGFFEEGRIRFRRDDLIRCGRDTVAGIVVVRLDARYRAPLYFPGNVEIGTIILHVGGAGFVFGQGLFQGETCIATAEVETVFVHPETARAVRIPKDVRAVLLEGMAGG